MTNIFVSYAREDKARVAQLVALIDSWNAEVWWDDRLVAGESFTEETERRLREADFVVVVWTPHSARSKWVLDEAAVGRDAEKLIPISFDGQAPPLGFRHIHCTDFTGWTASGDDKCVAALKEALTRQSNPSIRPALAQTSSPNLTQRRVLWRLAFAALAICVVALVGGLAVGVVSILTGRDSDKPSIAEATADLLAGRTPDDPEAAEAKRAVEAIGVSDRAEDRAALSSFAAGDQEHALDILEKLAADLKRAGDNEGAAEAYTRVGAIAILVDQGRGIAARRKAFDLAPESLPIFQGLYFDIYRLRGYPPASAFAREVIAKPSTSDRMRGFAYAHLSVSALADSAELEVAAENLLRVRALSERTGDPVLDGAVHWANGIFAWRQDRLTEAQNATDALVRVNESLAERVFAAGPEVSQVRILFTGGDWSGSFRFASEKLDARRRNGQFIPTPELEIACRAGLYAGLVDDAAPYCVALSGRSDPSGGAAARLYSAELAAARGDLDKARSELDASRELNADDAPIEAYRILIESRIAAKEGELDAAEALVWRYADLVRSDPAWRSRRATMLRLFGDWAIDAGSPERACAALKESRELYAAIGGAAGVAAIDALQPEARCS